MLERCAVPEKIRMQCHNGNGAYGANSATPAFEGIKHAPQVFGATAQKKRGRGFCLALDVAQSLQDLAEERSRPRVLCLLEKYRGGGMLNDDTPIRKVNVIGDFACEAHFG